MWLLFFLIFWSTSLSPFSSVYACMLFCHSFPNFSRHLMSLLEQGCVLSEETGGGAGVERVDGEGHGFGRWAPGLLPPGLRQSPGLREPGSFLVASPCWCVTMATVLSGFLGQFYLSRSLIVVHMILDIKHQNISSMWQQQGQWANGIT